MAGEKSILTLEETAQYLHKSTSWVYKNWKILGGRKLGGSLFFPAKEDLYEYLFSKRKGVEIRLHSEGNQAHRSVVQNKKRSKTGRSKKKGGSTKSRTTNDNRSDTNRHGIFGFSKQEA